MIRAGLRRVFVVVVVVLGGVALISVTFSALLGKSIPHGLAVGYYLAGCGCLIVSFLLGSRGPTRAGSSDDEVDANPTPIGIFGAPRGGRVGRRARRKATPEERHEARLSSIGLFVFGLFLLLLGAGFDPSRRMF